jgi:uncharacterized protein (TIGR02246 family)
MKLSKSLGFILLLGVLVSSSQAGDKEDVEAVLTKAWTAFNNKDYQTYFTYLADDLEVFTGVVTPLLHIGKPHIMEFVNGFAQLPSVTYTQQQNSIRIYNGNTAVVNGYFLFTVVGKGGTTTNQSGRNSTTLVKQNGKWLIVNFHFSSMF